MTTSIGILLDGQIRNRLPDGPVLGPVSIIDASDPTIPENLMRKALTIVVFTCLLAANAFATYTIVLKDGTRYKAKAKWTIVNGKALIHLESGQSLQLDANLIDVAQSEHLTKLGITDATVFNLTPQGQPNPNSRPAQPSLGSSVKLRKLPGQEQAAPTATPQPSTSAAPAVPLRAGAVPDQAIEKFRRAFENIGIYEQDVKATGGGSLRAELTADSEDKVFNAISATSFLIVRNAGITGVQIDMVELFMKTTNGGAAGRFQMTRADAEALDKRTISQQEYFVRKVLY
jgi:hypothetical protein